MHSKTEEDDTRSQRLEIRMRPSEAEALARVSERKGEPIASTVRRALSLYLGSEVDLGSAVGRELAAYRWVGDVDLLSAISDGHEMYRTLEDETQPARLLAVIDEHAQKDRRAIVKALFAAVVLNEKPEKAPAISDLWDRWCARRETKNDEERTRDDG